MIEGTPWNHFLVGCGGFLLLFLGLYSILLSALMWKWAKRLDYLENLLKDQDK